MGFLLFPRSSSFGKVMGDQCWRSSCCTLSDDKRNNNHNKNMLSAVPLFRVRLVRLRLILLVYWQTIPIFDNIRRGLSSEGRSFSKRNQTRRSCTHHHPRIRRINNNLGGLIFVGVRVSLPRTATTPSQNFGKAWWALYPCRLRAHGETVDNTMVLMQLASCILMIWSSDR